MTNATATPRQAGRYIRQQTGIGAYSAFIPEPLPPVPPIQYAAALLQALERATIAIGRLDATAIDLPEAKLFLYTYVRKEAVLSSQIEGTQSSLSDLLRYENAAVPSVPIEDVIEVSNYVAAMEYGLQRLREGFPLSLRLLREMHAVLMRGARGAHSDAGEFRRTQNWIGGTMPGNARFVPPPAHEVVPAMGALERFLHEGDGIPLLVKAGLAHVQFETIHPFLDGNGRLGRLLITLLLCADRVLTQPLLYLSLYFKVHRAEYYTALSRVRTDGDWEGWLAFYLAGVAAVAADATDRARRLRTIFEEDRARILARGPHAASAIRIHDALQQRALLSAAAAGGITGLTPPAVRRAFRLLETLGIVQEITGRRRDRLYAYRRYAEVLDEEAGV